ncbi:MAG: DUF4271 domain-containing protein [Alloprevotella sp.]|nr:DUF4271 domain-containing protein [Alloprevotella sp.]
MQQDSLQIVLPVDSVARADSVVAAPPTRVYLPPLELDTAGVSYTNPQVTLSPIPPQPLYNAENGYSLSSLQSPDTYFPYLDTPLADTVRTVVADSAFRANVLNTARENYTAERQAYSVSGDDYITGILLTSTFLTAYVIIHGKKFLHDHNLIPSFHRKPAQDTNVRTSLEIQGQMFLILATCFTLGIIATSFIERTQPDFSLPGTPYGLLIGSTLFFLSFYVAKIAFYGFVNGTFFDKATVIMWNDTYLFSIFLQGVLLLPLTLLVIYSKLPLDILMVAWIVMIVVAKVFLFGQAFGVFPVKKKAYLHILLYLCSVELIPPILLWHTLTYLVNTFFLPPNLF